uniref:Solute carrier family 38 member 3a n=1 Tax=Cyprinus carpio TaxID=7962 RepID=A0A8C1R359_CYPCA
MKYPFKVTLKYYILTPGNVEANLAESSEFLSNADDKKTPHFTDFEGKTSFGMSVFNLGNAIMGSGILGLAYAMANTGIVLFVILLTVIAGLSAYSIHLLLKSSGVVGIRAYEQLGFRAFGTPGKMAAGIAITLQNIGAMSSYLYIVKYEFPLVIQAFLKVDNPSGEWYLNGNYLVVIVSCSVILPLALMKQLGKSSQTDSYIKLHTPLILFTAYTVPILAFAFVCHPEVLPIYTELRNPTKTKMQHVSNISIGVMYIMYLLAALFGYLTFVDKVEAELLHTYSRIDPYDTLILCVRVAVLTAVTLTVPIVLFPVRRAIQQLFFPNKTFWWPRHIAIAVTLLSLINLLVIFAPNILGIFGVIGATSAPCLIFIFPAVFYIRIVPKEEEPFIFSPSLMCFFIITMALKIHL